MLYIVFTILPPVIYECCLVNARFYVPSLKMTSLEKKGYIIFDVGGENVPTFAVNMKHNAESCPLFNAEVKKGLRKLLAREKKPGIEQRSTV